MNRTLFSITTTLIVILVAGCDNNHEIYPNENNSIQVALHHPARSDYEKSVDLKRKAESILAIAGLKAGMSVADLDAGSGYYTELFSYVVGETGRVYLQNAQRYYTNQPQNIEERLKSNRLPNVIRVDSSFNELQIPNDLDLIFIGNAFHDIYAEQHQSEWNADPEQYIEQLYKSLKDGGKLLIIDHSAETGSGIETAQKLHRMDEAYIKSELKKVGFKLILSSEILRNPNDIKTLDIWNEKVFRKTDKFVFLFEK